MIDYQKFEELPKRVQYFVNTIKESGYEDITNYIFPSKYYGNNSFYCTVWIDSEEMIQGKIEDRCKINILLQRPSIKNIFGINIVNINVRYKNKQKLSKKFLPELKKRLKNSEDGVDIHAVRFDIKSEIEDPPSSCCVKKIQTFKNLRRY